MLRLVSMVVLLSTLSSCFNSGPVNKTGFYINMSGEPTTINPVTSTDAYASDIQGYVFERLLTKNVETYEDEASLATEWKISEDKMVFTFKLREGVKWHDGKEFTAEDVKFSFDVIFDDQYNTAHKRPYYEGIKEIQVIDKYNVKVIAKSKYFQNFDIIASGMSILPKHFYSNEANKNKFNKELIGTGPYKLDKYEKGKHFILKPNENWWGRNLEAQKGKYNFKRIMLKFVSDRNVSLEMLKKGDLDFMGFDPEIYIKKATGEEWGKSLIKVKTQNKTPKGYSFIGWNMRHPILKDVKVRKALYHLVNRDLMIDKFEFGMSVAARGPVYPSSPYDNKDIGVVDFNPNKALELLRASGWKDTDGDNILDKVIDGKKTKFSITILEPWEGYVKYLTVFKEDAKKAGVDINIKQIEWSSFIKLIDERKFEAIRLAWTANIDWDPKQIWHSSSIKGGSNFVGYSDKEVDKLIDEARQIYDRDQRIAMLKKVQKKIVDAYPYAWMTYKADTLYGHTNRIWKPQDTFQYDIGQEYWKVQE